MRPLLEVCVDSIQSAQAAADGGVDRLEVCSALALGGLTPTNGLLKTIRTNLGSLPLFAMIRPRPGDFCYSQLEIQQMINEIEEIKANQLADGFVLGVLKMDGTIDVDNCDRLVKTCHPLQVTFHRAFDVCCDPFVALDDIIAIGFHRILTSGQQTNAENGIEVIKMLMDKAGDKIILMPGRGIGVMNLETVLRELKPKEFHSSASMGHNSSMEYRKDTVSMGKEGNEYDWTVCDAKRVKCMIEIADRFQV